MSWPGCFHPGHQFLEIVRRQRRPRRERRGRGIDQADGGEIFLGVEGETRIHRHAGRQRHLMDQDGVAVGIGAGGLRGGDHAAGAADVFDHDRLAERFLHRVLDDARDRVSRAAGRKRHDHGDGMVRISLRQSGATGETTRGKKRRRERARKSHGSSRDRLLFCLAAATGIFAPSACPAQGGCGPCAASTQRAPLLRRRVTVAEGLDHLLVEGRQIVRFARGDEVGVGHHLFVDPGGAGIGQIGLQRRP